MKSNQIIAQTTCCICRQSIFLYLGEKYWYHEDGTIYCCDKMRQEKHKSQTPSLQMKIESIKEQQQAARECGKAYCCLRWREGQWRICYVTDDQSAADRWWQMHPAPARVYYSSGAIRNAK